MKKSKKINSKPVNEKGKKPIINKLIKIAIFVFIAFIISFIALIFIDKLIVSKVFI